MSQPLRIDLDQRERGRGLYAWTGPPPGSGDIHGNDAKPVRERIDQFFSGPGGRADNWRDLVEAAKAWSSGGDRAPYGYIDAFPRVDQWVNIHCIRVSDGQHSISTGYGSGYIYDETRAKLHPVQLTAIYGANNGLSPSDIEKYDISAGTASVLYDSPYHGEYSMCGNLWFSEDGARIFTACGNVFSATSSQTSDMYYVGALPDTARVASLDHSSETLKVVAIPGENLSDTTSDATVKIFASDFLTLSKNRCIADVCNNQRCILG